MACLVQSTTSRVYVPAINARPRPMQVYVARMKDLSRIHLGQPDTARYSRGLRLDCGRTCLDLPRQWRGGLSILSRRTVYELLEV